jgi:hypothetical protein
VSFTKYWIFPPFYFHHIQSIQIKRTWHTKWEEKKSEPKLTRRNKNKTFSKPVELILFPQQKNGKYFHKNTKLFDYIILFLLLACLFHLFIKTNRNIHFSNSMSSISPHSVSEENLFICILDLLFQVRMKKRGTKWNNCVNRHKEANFFIFLRDSSLPLCVLLMGKVYFIFFPLLFFCYHFKSFRSFSSQSRFMNWPRERKINSFLSLTSQNWTSPFSIFYSDFIFCDQFRYRRKNNWRYERKFSDYFACSSILFCVLLIA